MYFLRRAQLLLILNIRNDCQGPICCGCSWGLLGACQAWISSPSCCDFTATWFQPKKCLPGCEKIPHWFFSELFLAASQTPGSRAVSETQKAHCPIDAMKKRRRRRRAEPGHRHKLPNPVLMTPTLAQASPITPVMMSSSSVL